MATYPYFSFPVDTTVAANGTPLGTGMRTDQQLKSSLTLVDGLGHVATPPTPLTIVKPVAGTFNGIVGPY